MKRGKSAKGGPDELRPEYDATVLKNGARGKYFARFSAGTNLVRLDADVSKAFPDDKAVNDALRLLMSTAKRAVRKRSA